MYNSSTQCRFKLRSAYSNWVHEILNGVWDQKLWNGFQVAFMFNHIPGTFNRKCLVMENEIDRVYRTSVPQVERSPRSPAGSKRLPILIAFPDYRFGSAGDSDVVRRHAQELVALVPDLVVASGSQNVAALQQVSRTVPIVFLGIVDPVGAGFVASLARPGGNTTGFTPFEYGMGGKWLELLKQIAPGMTQAAVLRDPSITAGVGQFAAIQSVAPLFGVELRPVDVRDAGEIERTIAALHFGPTVDSS